MKVSEHLNGVILFKPQVFEDERGFFMESWKSNQFEELGLPTIFLQDNHSGSIKNVIRGMHFQFDPPMGKLIRVTYGSAFVVEVDIRHNSPTLGQWIGFELSAENRNIIWVPPGFANGFLATSDFCEMQYKCTALWNKTGEGAINWNDPKIGIDWGINDPILSEKDKNAQTLDEWLLQDVSKKLSI
ncbi:MAG: dTDP-4-dehydrorhamnose 3,5-epimerase [Candidatus Kapabacteria bacterium]|nr:dTDP-4-dehydrorhamnose 3,5-epimerase [Candidatus Kapabacteria bacterium]